MTLGALLVAAAPPSERHAAAGRYNVPPVYVSVPSAGPAVNAIANGGFESGGVNDGWYQCGDAPAFTTKEHPYEGLYDEYSGMASGSGEPLGNSGVCQRVTIPLDAVLTAQLYQLSNEANALYAYQEADLLDDRGSVVLNLYRSVNNRAAWVKGTWNLAAYAGRTVWIYFGVHGDGYPNDSTQQFLDGVVLRSAGVSKAK
ncbi:MAG TPA: hypothetical protein VEW74_07045 [Candidatus Nitrosotalea sp.]|nr:hypothetical protein [Candidatus Nitrosotalea sp.]